MSAAGDGLKNAHARREEAKREKKAAQAKVEKLQDEIWTVERKIKTVQEALSKEYEYK